MNLLESTHEALKQKLARGVVQFAFKKLDGSLRTATEMKDVTDFDVSSVRLPALQVREFAGLVFAASENPPPFEEYVAGIAERLAVSSHALDDLRFHQHLSYDIDCNWKTYVDNYLEGYHVPHVHPELNKLLDYRSYVTETNRWYSMQFSPLESGDDLYGSGEALYYFMYPNTMLNILHKRHTQLLCGDCNVDHSVS